MRVRGILNGVFSSRHKEPPKPNGFGGSSFIVQATGSAGNLLFLHYAETLGAFVRRHNHNQATGRESGSLDVVLTFAHLDTAQQPAGQVEDASFAVAYGKQGYTLGKERGIDHRVCGTITVDTRRQVAGRLDVHHEIVATTLVDVVHGGVGMAWFVFLMPGISKLNSQTSLGNLGIGRNGDIDREIFHQGIAIGRQAAIFKRLTTYSLDHFTLVVKIEVAVPVGKEYGMTPNHLLGTLYTQGKLLTGFYRKGRLGVDKYGRRFGRKRIVEALNGTSRCGRGHITSFGIVNRSRGLFPFGQEGGR